MTPNALAPDSADFEIEAALLLQNLNFLKTLPVSIYTLYKKWDELRHYHPPQPEFVQAAKNRIWRPDPNHFTGDSPDKAAAMILDLCAMRPKLIVVGTSKADSANFRLWETYRYFISSAENNPVPARVIRFLIIDDADPHKRVLGIAAVSSDVNSLACRDKYIGWSIADRTDAGKLNHTAIASTIVPTQPFGFNFLGGKLAAALMTTSVVRDEWRSRYGDCLAGMTTTCLYGSPCMYDGIPRWQKLGNATGSVLLVPDKEIYHYWRRWVAQHRSAEFHNVTEAKGRAGAAVSEKLRVLGLIFATAGLSPANFKHGFRRGVYFSGFYKNTREFLCGKIPEEKLVLKPSIQRDVEGVLDWWRSKAIQRFLNLRRRKQLQGEVHWYDDMHRIDFATAKAKYLHLIG